MAADATAPAPETIREQLHRILESKEFDASERNRRFLHYIVEEKLAGRSDRIKAYSVATSVFDRDGTFDAQTDPIVRIEAGRLRRSLDHYYLTAGQNDPLRISIPKGSYVPNFVFVEETLPIPDLVVAAAPTPVQPAEQTSDSVRPLDKKHWRSRDFPLAIGILVPVVAVFIWLVTAWFAGFPPFANKDGRIAALRNGPAILVVPFENDGGSAQQNDLAHGFTREVITGLTRFNTLFVFGPETSFRYGDAALSPKTIQELGIDFVLSGATATAADGFHATLTLVNAKTGQYVWSGKFDASFDAAEILKVRDNVANQVVRELAQPYGVIFADKAREIEGKPPKSFTSYQCVLQFYRYWHSFDAQLYTPTRECLERAVVEEPGYADALASLALIYVDAYRFRPGGTEVTTDPLKKALELAQRSIELAPDSTHSYQALAMVYWLMRDVDHSIDAAERGLRLNPNDTSLMADLGMRYCFLEQWDKGVPLVKESFARNPGQPSWYHIPLYLDDYMHGRYEDALAEAWKIDSPSIIHNTLGFAIAYAKLGRMQEAEAEVQKMLKINPAYGDQVEADLQMRNIHPDIIKAIVDGLQAAGLAVKNAPLGRGS